MVVEWIQDPDGAEKWARARAGDFDGNPISLEDMTNLVQWFMEGETDIPTVRPELSGAGPQQPTTTPSSVVPISQPRVGTFGP
jgi:hypothetical protein